MDLTTQLYNASLVGDSFIRRLRDDISAKTEAEFEPNLGFVEAQVRYVCQGGWKIDDISANVDEIIDQWPDYIVIQCGSNDLCHSSHPESVADRLLQTAEEVRIASEAKLVLVCQIMTRELSSFLPTMDAVEEYNIKVQKANAFLKVVCSEYSGVRYWKHKGLTNPSESGLGPCVGDDGVHFNERGQYKFYKSIRGAMNFAAKHY